MTGPKSRAKPKAIQSVNRAMDILEALNQREEPANLTELSAILGLNKTTLFHLIKTLEARNFVAMNPATGRYTLGLKLFELGQSVEHQTIVMNIARPLMRAIRDKYNETLHLGVLQESGDHLYATYIDKVESTNPIRLASRIGRHIPLHCTALGKMFLSTLSREQFDQMLGSEPLARYTDKTFTDRDELFAEIAASRRRGWFFDNKEYEPEVHCIAVPVHDGAGRLAAGISISMPADRLTGAVKENLIPDMLELSRRLTRELRGA